MLHSLHFQERYLLKIKAKVDMKSIYVFLRKCKALTPGIFLSLWFKVKYVNVWHELKSWWHFYIALYLFEDGSVAALNNSYVQSFALRLKTYKFYIHQTSLTNGHQKNLMKMRPLWPIKTHPQDIATLLNFWHSLKRM